MIIQQLLQKFAFNVRISVNKVCPRNKMSRSALANLTAQYTDSENEEDQNADESSDSQNSQASQVIIPSKPATPAQSPEKQAASDTKNRKGGSKRKKALRLVSYQDDTIVSDDEGNADDSSEESTSDSGGEENTASTSNNSNALKERMTPMDVDDPKALAGESGSGVGTNSRVSSSLQSNKPEKSEKYAHYGFSLPPEPKGKPSQELVDKIRNLYDKMETNNMDMNRIIQERKEFRNPSIYEKLIQFCDINEFGTNYPPEMYDPLKWGPESYYEELARVQKNEMLKRQKERKDNDKIEQATALARKVEEEAKKRKSKWDQPAPAKPVVPPALTTTVTGTKGTVISAFGSLPKKPAA